MIFVTRSPSQSVYIALGPDVDPGTPVGEIFKDGPIRLRVVTAHGSQVRLGVDLPPLLEMRREAQPANGLPPDLP